MVSIANELNKISKTPTGNNWNEHLIHTRLTSKIFHGYQEMTLFLMEKQFLLRSLNR
ncbi:hypothetical protein [Virgibacillus proomii]|uniref:hypothetical protein n=1 Tax=Virgibacillus proomii TaxID=84407 RepID=UPI00359F7956